MSDEMKRFKTEYLDQMLYIAKRDWEYAREVMKEDGVNPETVVLAKDFFKACDLAYALYNPADWGKDGKHVEVVDRVYGWLDGGRSWAYWHEFFARKHGDADIGTRTESKAGAGDWLYSSRYSTYEKILKEYWKKETIISWNTEYFHIKCTWHELFDYLDTYTKGIDTWFRTKEVKKNVMLNRSVVMLQNWKNSKRKIAFLQACPYNDSDREG